MNRLLVLFAILNSFTLPNAFAQSDAMLNLSRYVSYFGFTNGRVNYDNASNNKYLWAASDDDLLQFGVLAGDEIPDNPLEVALLTYYSPEVRNMRPSEAAAMLPANNPRLAGLKLGAAVYQEIQVLRFLADTSAVTRCEAMLRFVYERNGVTRADVEAFYRNGIRRLVAEVVGDEFNKVSFLLTNLAADRTYNSTLKRNPQNGHFTLSYERPSVANDDKKLSTPTLEALLSAMRNNGDFVQPDIDTVRDHAGLIPAVVFASVRNNSLDLLTEILTNFYLNPNMATYSAIRDVDVLYTDEAILSRGASPIFGIIENAYDGVLISLNERLAKKVFDDYAAIRNSPRRISLPESTQRVLLDSKVIESTRRNR